MKAVNNVSTKLCFQLSVCFRKSYSITYSSEENTTASD